MVARCSDNWELSSVEKSVIPDPRTPIVIRSAEDASQTLKSRSDLSYRLFEKLELHGNVARQSIFPGALFRNCVLRDCDFSRSDFEGTRFEKCEFENVSFEDADIRSTRFADCLLRNCSFVGSYFSRNFILASVVEYCQFDRATLLNNEFKDSSLRNISNQVSTILHSDFVNTSFSNVSLANCTCLYSYFENCNFDQFETNADAVGLSFGLPESALATTKLVFLGRSEQAPPPDTVVDNLLQEFCSRGWNLHTLLTELNFGRAQPVKAWLDIFDFFIAEARSQRVIKSDDTAFVLRVASKLAQRGALPMFSAIAAYDRTAKEEVAFEGDVLTSRSLADIRVGLSSLLTFMETEFLAGTASVGGIPVDEILKTEFVFEEKPVSPTVECLESITKAILPTHQAIAYISARSGSWIEVLQMTSASG